VTGESYGPRRRPEAGGYSRGDETRARIIRSAVEIFGRDGYARASTRKIAAAAAVNPPALQYYFGSKEGLHQACAQFLIDRFEETTGAALKAADNAVAGGDPGAALDALCHILEVTLEISLGASDVKIWNRFMTRGQIDGAGPAFPLIREGIVTPIHSTCARLIGVITGAGGEDPNSRLRAAAVLSQLSAFSINRESTLKNLGWPDFAEGRAEAAKAIVLAHTRAALGAKIGS
jgi:AcrR family transcriptional regulator